MGLALQLTDETCNEICRQVLCATYIRWYHDPETRKKALDALLLVIGAVSDEGQWHDFMREVDHAENPQ